MLARAHPRQEERLTALRSLEILDTPREIVYDEIVELVADVCEAPIAVVNLIDENRQWFKAEVGLGTRETPLETSICSHVILDPGLTVIPDTLEDARMSDNPLCFAPMNLRFYAGMCLETEDSLPIGTLCVLDTRPRELTARQKKFLTILGRQVMAQIRLSHQLKQAELLRLEVDHRVRNSLGIVQSVLSLQARASGNEEVRDALQMASDRVAAVGQVHNELHQSGQTAHVNVKDFVAGLARSLGMQTGESVKITTDMPSTNITAQDAARVGLVINELVTNAVRHGIEKGKTGNIRITGEHREGRIWFTVADDGDGLPADFNPANSRGLGMRLANSLAAGFGGALTWASDNGARFGFNLAVAGE